MWLTVHSAQTRQSVTWRIQITRCGDQPPRHYAVFNWNCTLCVGPCHRLLVQNGRGWPAMIDDQWPVAGWFERRAATLFKQWALTTNSAGHTAMMSSRRCIPRFFAHCAPSSGSPSELFASPVSCLYLPRNSYVRDPIERRRRAFLSLRCPRTNLRNRAGHSRGLHSRASLALHVPPEIFGGT